MEKPTKDDLLAAHLPGLLEYHRLMLGDETRNRLLADAIHRSVKPGSSFLDVGAGSGVWAIYSALCGAERAVAVEVEEGLIPCIYKHAVENGVSDRVEIVHGRSMDVQIDGKFDVIVSELFGGDALGPDSIHSMIDVRERFLADGGVLIPQEFTMFAAPVHLSSVSASVPAGIPVKTEFLKGLRLNYPHNIPFNDQSRLEFLADPVELISTAFTTVTSPPHLSGLSAAWHLEDVSRANAIATFNRTRFLPGIEMDTRESQSWGVIVYEFEPFDRQTGTLRSQLTVDAMNSSWAVSIDGQSDVRPKSYSPIFAFTRVRMAEQMTPYESFPSE